jgi:hypothetical protein
VSIGPGAGQRRRGVPVLAEPVELDEVGEPDGRRRRLRSPQWLRDGEWRLLLVAVLTIWAGSRLAVLLASVFGDWTTGDSRDELRHLGVLWLQWDTVWYVDIAANGYFKPGTENVQYECCTHAFFPGMPLAMRVVDIVAPGGLVPAGLLISAVSGAIAVVALARLARYELPAGSAPQDRMDIGTRTVLYLVLSPYALFLFAVYTEALFLAFALPAWLAVRRGDWRAAGLLTAGASFVRITGLFLLAAVAVEYLVSRRRAGLPILSFSMLWLAAPLATGGGYLLWLYTRTGSWLAWQEAQASELSWLRASTGPGDALQLTLDSAIRNPETLPDFAVARRAELVAMVVGLVLLVVLVRLRRWGESTFLALNVLALGTAGVYFAIPRATLVWWPLWLLLARLTMLHWRWLHPLYLWTAAPLMVVLTIAFTQGYWVN